MRVELFRAHQAMLRRPALQTDQGTDGLTIPAVGDSYINPDFRCATEVPSEQIAQRGWWATQQRRSDLQEFLLGFLTNPVSHDGRLLVLGQPGSGKSLLTQVLAARLLAEDFLAVRVALREVTADTDLQTQIEQATRASTGQSLRWPQLVRTADGAQPVVLLDGFDELLQATGMSQSNFLEKVVAFQQREADQGRPVAVLVTSRLSVADRARPVQLMTTVLLEPFDDEQVSRWVDVWNYHNGAVLAARGFATLPATAVLAHPDLARQPLLLLMLALYEPGTFLSEGLMRALGDRTTHPADPQPHQHPTSIGRHIRRDTLVEGVNPTRWRPTSRTRHLITPGRRPHHDHITSVLNALDQQRRKP